MQATTRTAKRPIIHIDENLEPAPAKRPLADKAVIAADKENSQVTRKTTTVKKAAAPAALAPRATTTVAAKPAAPVDIKPLAAAPPTRSLTMVASKTAAKAKASVSTTVKPAAPSVLNLSFQEADMEPMLIDSKVQLPPGVEDIDALSNDPAIVSEYANDIFDYYFIKEKEVHPSPNHLVSHPELTAEMRSMLIDWLVDVHTRLAKTGDVLFLNVYLVDRFLTLLSQQRPARMIKRVHFQLLGIACLFIASKVEEVNAICVADLCFLCDNKFSREEIIKLESIVLSTLGFNLTVPTSLQFLRRFSRAGGLEPEVHMLTRYLLDSSLAEYAMLQYLPSMVAASALYLAKRLSDQDNDDVWTPTLAHYTKYEEADLLPCATALNEMLKRRPRAEPKNLPSVQRKYLSKKCYQVANVQPLDEL